ncbi:hypothetical protein Y032_0454g1734 [Ancylostoma ceylanicum]|uniref:Uncharacterized protein n=1 Tax=Ancylostoma ceylanicum TaxID=53326 RepID=A0A016X085_9BILA|nr:hypothetical protein Y032_0454g1734 [Ancylostoma ceylanicum]
MVKIGKQRRVVLKQSGGEGSRKNTVDVQVKEGEVTTRRNTFDLQFEGGARIRSRANTLELKLNGEVMKDSAEDTQSTPRGSRTLSVIRHDSTNGSPANAANAQNLTIDNTQTWSTFNPKRQFYVLKAVFIMMCLVDIMHWAYMLRDDTLENPNSWRFYKKFQSFDIYYLVARMFGDIFTCVLGLGAAMWTRKPILTLPCTTIQLLFLLIRAVVWTARGYNKALLRVESSSEDKLFVACEFILPAVWALLSVLIVRTMKQLRSYEQLHGYAHPPVIVLTVKNDDNDESVQIEIA